MKIKLKLDKKAILEFLLQNVEKIVFGAVALGFFFIVYSAIQVQRYNKTPEELKKAAEAGKKTIERASIQDILAAPEESELKKVLTAKVDYVADAKRSRIRIEDKHYETPIPWDPPLFEKTQPRPTPKVLAALKLQGKAEVGSINSMSAPPAPPSPPPAAGDGRHRPTRDQPVAPGMASIGPQGERFIIITALVPLEKQLDEYNSDFKGPNYDPRTDIPDYLGYWIDRLELTSPTDADNPDWGKAKHIWYDDALKEAVTKFGSMSNAEFVHPKYLDPKKRLVYPLPVLNNRQWGESVAHKPEIPMLELGPGGTPINPMGPGFGGPGTMPSLGTPGTPTAAGPAPEGAATLSPEDRAAENREGMPGSPYQPPPMTAGNPEENKAPTYYLFRHLDFHVEPGKSYIYRVQLVLANPNYLKKASGLKEPEQAKSRTLKTDWSDKSPIISVPHDTRLLAVAVKGLEQIQLRTGQILAIKWIQKKGIEAFEKFSIERGQIANYPDKTFTPTNTPTQPFPGSAGGRAGMPPMMPPMAPGFGGAGGRASMPPMMPPMAPGFGGAGGRAGMPPMMPPMAPGMGMPPMMPGAMPSSSPGQNGPFKVNYFSGMVAIDFRGGEKQKGSKLTSVGELLMMAPDGTLTVLNEQDDKPDYQQKTAKPPEPAAPVGPAVGQPTPGPHPRKGLGDVEGSKKTPKKGVNPKPTK
jgi:hypothetical protein